MLFELVLGLHQLQMKGGLILDVIHIVGTKMIEAGIDGLSRRNNLGGMTKGMNHLHFFPVISSSGSKIRQVGAMD